MDGSGFVSPFSGHRKVTIVQGTNGTTEALDGEMEIQARNLGHSQ